jgi:uncharacterized protein
MGVFRHLEACDYVRQRWKNGGGTTTELAREDAGDRWLWRVSIADVEVSGPFSHFAGYRRIIALLDGNGMALSFDRAPQVIIDRPHESFAFDGGWRTDCRLLDGPVRDFNLIVDDRRMQASLEFRVQSLDTEIGETALLHAIRGRWRADGDECGCTLAPGDTLRVEGPGLLSLTALAVDAVLALAHLVRRRIIPDDDGGINLTSRRDAP